MLTIELPVPTAGGPDKAVIPDGTLRDTKTEPECDEQVMEDQPPPADQPLPDDQPLAIEADLQERETRTDVARKINVDKMNQAPKVDVDKLLQVGPAP